MLDVFNEYADLFDGPLYSISERVDKLLRPALPSRRDMTAEFARQLLRAVDGVEIVQAKPVRSVFVETAPGVEEEYRRRHLFARLLVEHEDACVLEASGESTRRAAADIVRGSALEVARAMADRIASQVVDIRAERALNRSALAEPRLEPIVLHVHDPLPCIPGEERGEPLFFMDYNTARVGVVFAAWYFVTPAAPKETPCPQP